LGIRERIDAMAAGLMTPNPQVGSVSRMPQTTINPDSGGPFIRRAPKSAMAGFKVTGQSFGALITQNLRPVGGYLRRLICKVTASGGAKGNATVAAAADAPGNCIATLILRDPFGQPIVNGDGYGITQFSAWGGNYGMWAGSSYANLPSFSGVDTNGDFTFTFSIDLENLSDAWAALPSLNAAAQPQLTVNLAASAALYTTPPDTLPSISFEVLQEYYAVPIANPGEAPPDVGSSRQIQYATAAQGISSASAVNVVLPRVGTWIDTILLILRDSTGARVDAFPDPFSFWVDGVPRLIDVPFSRMEDLVYQQFGITRPAGVLPLSFRDSIQTLVSQVDDASGWLLTTPGTLLEVRGTWGTVSSGPAQLTTLTGEDYPFGGIVAHLAEAA
jgi:hypothetical protein